MVRGKPPYAHFLYFRLMGSFTGESGNEGLLGKNRESAQCPKGDAKSGMVIERQSHRHKTNKFCGPGLCSGASRQQQRE